MRSFTLNIDEKYFNLLWRSITCRENFLLERISNESEDSDEAALLSNDLVYLRLCKKSLEEMAKTAVFSEGAFSLEEKFFDLSDL
jgi:hypothetical protein